MSRRWQPDGFGVALIITCVVLAVIIVFAVIQDSKFQRSKTEACVERGGRVLENTETTTGVGVSPSNGQPVVTTGSSTTRYCLTEDGRIIDIW